MPEPRQQAPDETYLETVHRLALAQKRAARSAPAYSRFVNRKLGRLLAALAYQRGLTPNTVTCISAGLTFTGVAALALVPTSVGTGLLVSGALVLGYAFDAADGQLARLTASGSRAGEFLDHFVDCIKCSALHGAVLIGLFRFRDVPPRVLLVPAAYQVVSAGLFFSMVLVEKLRGQVARPLDAAGAPGVVADPPAPSALRSVLVIATDYGLLCLVFLTWGRTEVFLPVYAALLLGNAAFLAAAALKWYRELADAERALSARPA